MKTGAKLAVGIGVVSVLGGIVYLATRPAKGEEGLANIYGTVGKRTEDGTGFEGLPDVQVTLDALETTTDQSGNYYFDALQPGDYAITFIKEGYQDRTATVTLTGGQNRLDVILVPVGESPPPPPSPEANTLTIEIDPVDAGWVIVEPDKPFYEWGEHVDLTAHANEEYVFDYWSVKSRLRDYFDPDDPDLMNRKITIPMPYAETFELIGSITATAHFVEVGATPMLGTLRLYSASSPTPARQITIPMGEDFHVTGIITLPKIEAEHPLTLRFFFRAAPAPGKGKVIFRGEMQWEGPQAAITAPFDITIDVEYSPIRSLTYLAQPGTYLIYSTCSLGPDIEDEDGNEEPYFTFWKELKTVNLVVTIIP